MQQTEKEALMCITILGQYYVISPKQKPAFGDNVLHTQGDN